MTRWGQVSSGKAGNEYVKKGVEKMANAYNWVSQAVYKVSADDAGAEFERILETGELTAERIVDESRPKDAVLHNEFEWNDSIAAEKYRREQARTMLRCLIKVTDDRPPTRAFFTIDYTNKRKGTYEQIEVIVADDQKADKLLKIALGELKSFRKKYDSLSQLADLFTVIDKFLEGHGDNG